MGKSTLPDGCPESHAVYFGSFIACTNPGPHKDNKGTPGKQRRWEWVPAHWREMIPKPTKQSEITDPSQQSTDLSRNPVVGRVPA